MKVSGKAEKIQGKFTLEYAGKGSRKQELKQGRLAFEAGNLALQLLTKDFYYRVELVKATCVGTYMDCSGLVPGEKIEYGGHIDFLIVWTGEIGKAKITFQWTRPEEELSELVLTGIEHPFGNPSLMSSKIDVRAKSFSAKTEQVAKDLVRLVGEAIKRLQEPLDKKTRKVSEAAQEVSSLVETSQEAVV